MNENTNFGIRIADLNIRLSCKYPYTQKLCEDFLTDAADADIAAETSASEIAEEDRNFETGRLLPGYSESICLYRSIAEQLPRFDGFVFHGAALNINGKGTVFTARSGVGKTTHISLLLKNYPENISIINGDKPIIRKTDGQWRVYSTPWAGKEGMRTNSSAPLSSIVLLERSTENFIEQVSPEHHFDALCKQIYLPRYGEMQLKTFELIDDLAKKISFYRLGCNISDEAAKTSYTALR